MEYPSKLHILPGVLTTNAQYNNLVQNVQWQEKALYHILPKRFCQRCYQSLCKHKLPRISKENGFISTEIPTHIKQLNTIEASCISCILPCFTLSRKAAVTQPKTLGPAVYIPIDPLTTFKNLLPRMQQDLNWLEIQFCEQGRGARKDPTIRGFINKRKVLEALQIILKSPIYQQLNCYIDPQWMEAELEETENYEVIENIQKIAEDKQMHSSIIPKGFEYKDSYQIDQTPVTYQNPEEVTVTNEKDTPTNDEMFGQHRPFCQQLNKEIPAITTNTAERINLFKVLDNIMDIPEEAMFPTAFGGRKRNEIKIQATKFEVFQNELERADFQHQVVIKIFHDYFRLVQDYSNRKRAHIFKRLKGNNKLDQTEKIIHKAEDELLADIRSSPMFWRRKRGYLFTMLRQLG